MAKRRFHLKAASAANSAASLSKKSTTISKDTTLHRGRKKRLETKRRFDKKKEFIKAEIEKLEQDSKSKKQKSKTSKKDLGPALAILGKIADELPKTQAEPEKPNYRNRSVTNHRKRTKIAEEEREQVQRVQQHEAFKSNPVEALRQHLMNTVSSDPSEIPPALKPGMAGAPKIGKVDTKEKQKKAGKEVDTSGMSVPDKETMEKLREEARERVVRKREQKAVYAAAAIKHKRRKTSGKIEKQTLSGLLARGGRGRIGVKRPKI